MTSILFQTTMRTSIVSRIVPLRLVRAISNYFPPISSTKKFSTKVDEYPSSKRIVTDKLLYKKPIATLIIDCESEEFTESSEKQTVSWLPVTNFVKNITKPQYDMYNMKSFDKIYDKQKDTIDEILGNIPFVIGNLYEFIREQSISKMSFRPTIESKLNRWNFEVDFNKFGRKVRLTKPDREMVELDFDSSVYKLDEFIRNNDSYGLSYFLRVDKGLKQLLKLYDIIYTNENLKGINIIIDLKRHLSNIIITIPLNHDKPQLINVVNSQFNLLNKEAFNNIKQIKCKLLKIHDKQSLIVVKLRVTHNLSRFMNHE